MKKSTSDSLGELLRRGDPAADQPEARSVDERANALLARCASDASEGSEGHAAAISFRCRPFEKKRAFFLVAGGVVASAAAVVFLGVVQNHDAASRPPLTSARLTPHPEVRHVLPMTPHTLDASVKPPEVVVDNGVPTKHLTSEGATTHQVSRRRPFFAVATRFPLPGNLARQSRRAAPERVASATPSPVLADRLHSSKVTEPAEPVVTRVIIEADDTTVQPNTPIATPNSETTSVAIALTPQSHAVIVSHVAAASATDL